MLTCLYVYIYIYIYKNEYIIWRAVRTSPARATAWHKRAMGPGGAPEPLSRRPWLGPWALEAPLQGTHQLPYHRINYCLQKTISYVECAPIAYANAILKYAPVT